MYLVALGWLYVALMMSIAEATNTNGSVLGGIITFLLYGLLPTALLMYILGTPARKQRIKAREAAEHAAWLAAQPPQPGPLPEKAVPSAASGIASADPDAGGQAPAGPVAPMGKET